MSSRVRDDVSELFICFCEVAQPETPENDGWIIQKFPDSFNEKEVLASVPKFVYPCYFENNTVQHFSFVLTDVESKWTFGFCRHDPKSSTALVILSYLPWHDVLFGMLNTVAELIRACEVTDLTDFLADMIKRDLPEGGTKLSIRLNEKINTFNCTIPSLNVLPTITENCNLKEYYNAVDTNNMIELFASMLHERRIVIKSHKLHRLSACVQAANTVLYPMNWQHIFIPLLPRHLTDYLLAPMPFLIGIPTSIWDTVKKSEIGEVVVLDADTNIIETVFHDVESLPVDVVKFLKSQLKNQAAMQDDGFARTFLRALVRLIGGYRDALKFQQGQKITFNPDSFVESRPPAMHAFLREMLQLQIFCQFIEERLDMLNAGLGFSDEFEFEAYNYTAKVSNPINDQYKTWVATMKKQGTVFFKTVKKRTNPAMQSAVRTVKEKGKDVKSAYKGMRTKLRKDGHHHPHGQHAHSLANSAQVLDRMDGVGSSAFHRARPLTIGTPVAAATYRRQKPTPAVTTSRSNEYVPLSSPTDDLSSPAYEEEMPAPRLDMDLLGDMQDELNRQCSLLDSSPPVDRTLKPVRSLDGSALPGRDAAETWGGAAPSVLQPLRAPRSSHPPLSRPSWSLPLSSPSTPPTTLAPTNPFAFTFQKPSPFLTDPFGFAAFGAGTTLLNSNANPFFQQPPPALSSSFPLFPPPQSTVSVEGVSSKCNGTADLIRLDSISSQNENMSRENSDDSIKFKTGVMNPLYPYYTLSSNAGGSSSAHGRSEPANGIIEPAMRPFPNNTSFVHNGQRASTNFNKHDMDLLKEYGIDFPREAAVAKASSNNNNARSEPRDPFDLPFESTTTRQNTPSTWATFD